MVMQSAFIDRKTTLKKKQESFTPTKYERNYEPIDFSGRPPLPSPNCLPTSFALEKNAVIFVTCFVLQHFHPSFLPPVRPCKNKPLIYFQMTLFVIVCCAASVSAERVLSPPGWPSGAVCSAPLLPPSLRHFRVLFGPRL